MAEKPLKKQQPPKPKQPSPAAVKPRAARPKKQPPTPPDAMEVHHHPDLHHKPKPFKEYLLEGLMIFIAVMLGFIAENVRETITDHEHVKELTSQLMRDMKADTAQLNHIRAFERTIYAADDSVIHLAQEPAGAAKQDKLLPFMVSSHSVLIFHPTSGAITAIKNELHLKQFSDSKIIGLIAEYEKHAELFHTVQDITLQYQRTLIEPFMLSHFNAAQLSAAFAKQKPGAPTLRNLSTNDLPQLGANMVLVRINTNEQLQDVEMVRKDVMQLLQYTREQYQPDEN